MPESISCWPGGICTLREKGCHWLPGSRVDPLNARRRTMIMTTTETITSTSTGGRLVATDGRELPLAQVHLSAEAAGGIARVVLTQRFENPFDVPLEVRYLLPLPSDGAVSGLSFLLG